MYRTEQESETDFLKFLAPTPGDAMIPLTFPNKELQGKLTSSDVEKELQGTLTSSDVTPIVPCMLTDDVSMDLDIGVLWKLF